MQRTKPLFYYDLMQWPLDTDILGDMDHWVRTYLDSGQHWHDWHRLVAIHHRALIAYGNHEALGSNPWSDDELLPRHAL